MSRLKQLQHEVSAKVIAWDTLRVSLLWVYEDVPKKSRGGVVVTATHCWYIMRGSVTVYLNDGRVLTIEAGNWFVLPQGRLERTFSEDAYLISLHFRARWPDDSRLFSQDEHLIIPDRQGQGLLEQAQAMLAYVKKTFPEVELFITTEHASALEYLQLQKLLLGWIIEFIEVHRAMGYSTHTLSPMDERMVNAREYIDQHIFSQVLPEGVIAAKVGISVSQLNRLFSAQYGKTPRRYMEDRRLALAKRLLQGSDVSIKQLAFNMGFKQLSHFSSWFRRQADVSPRAFRRKQLQSRDYSF